MSTAPPLEKRVFFHGLDEVRALAALAVMVHHIELYKNRDGLRSLYKSAAAPLISHLGENGVRGFFVLSGFLITYLLLTEKQRFGKLNLNRFYLRRALRIWPLYFLVVLIGFVLLPLLARLLPWLQAERHYYSLLVDLAQNPLPRLLLFLFLLPNVALKFFYPVAGASQSWSVGVEEQFYLIWPHLVQHGSKRGLPIAFLSLGLLYPLAPLILAPLSPALAEGFTKFVQMLPIHLMALGAFGAHLLFSPHQALKKFIQSPLIFTLNTALLIYLLWAPVHSVLFGLVAALELLFIVQPGFRFNLRSRTLAGLGTISYGIYMLHPMVMFLSFGLLNSILHVRPKSPTYHLLAYLLTVGGTLALSFLSYTFFERRFIRIKDRSFTVVPSGRSLA